MVMSTGNLIAIVIVIILVFVFLIVVFVTSGPPAPTPGPTPFPPIDPFTEERVVGSAGDVIPPPENPPVGFTPLSVTLDDDVVGGVNLEPAEQSLSRQFRVNQSQIVSQTNTGLGNITLLDIRPDGNFVHDFPTLVANENAYPPNTTVENNSDYSGSNDTTSGTEIPNFPTIINRNLSIRDTLFSSRGPNKASSGVYTIKYDTHYNAETNHKFGDQDFGNKISYDIAVNAVGNGDSTILIRSSGTGTLTVTQQTPYSS